MRLWDLTAKQPQSTARILIGHEGPVSLVAFSADGRWLVMGGDDMIVRFWPLRLDDLLQQAERAVGRNLTRKEWDELFPGELYRKTFERLPYPPDYQPPAPGLKPPG